jgi:putative ABC transport system substrate-binding protein
VAFENQTLRAAQAATTEIPIVFLHASDPVADGVVRSLAHPGGNMTGFVVLGNAPTKEVELFKQLVPSLRRLLVLSDPDDPGCRSSAETFSRPRGIEDPGDRA